MLKNIIVLPDGTELSTGSGLKNFIKSIKITECVNSEEEFTTGSAFATILEASIFTRGGGLTITAGDDVVLYKADDTGTRTQVGVITLEKPTRPTANTMKLTGYDHVAKLDKDLTDWLKSLDEWPYTINAFAGMVCEQCGLTFVASGVPNGDFLIPQFSKSGVTGRQIMRWLGEICCRFVRATSTGDIAFGWYTPSAKSITPSGDPFIFANGLSYETYKVAPIDAVQLRMADSTDGALWPPAEDGANSYIISGNAILLSHVSESLLPILEAIKAELSTVTYTPCNVSIPANLDIRAGNIVDITDKNGNTITAYVMTKTTSGQKDALECTGSPRRDSSSAINNKSDADKAAESESFASSAAQEAVDKQTQEDIFSKLTDNGRIQGFLMEDGQIYVNAAYISSLEKLFAKDIIMTGKFTSTGEAYLPPTQEDAFYTLRHIYYPDRYPMPEEYDFDLNGDGVLDDQDAFMAMDVANGKLAMKDVPGAVKTQVTIIIDMGNPEKPIRIYGKNMWGTEIESFIGPDVYNCSFAAKDYLNSIVRPYKNDAGETYLHFCPLESIPVRLTNIAKPKEPEDAVSLAYLSENFVIQGTVNGWTYRKWGSGVAECWCSVSVSNLACNTAWGSVYETAEISLPDFPFPFSSAPVVGLNWEGDRGAITEGIKGLTTTSAGKTLLMRATSRNITGRIMIHATGTWK